MSKILACVAHPDDETIGAGGTLALHAARGDEVQLVIATVAYTPDWSEALIAQKRIEANEAARVLGLRKVHYLELPAAKLDTIPQKTLNDQLGRIVREFRPEVVYTNHGGDVNKDHRLVFDAVMVATRPLPGASVRRVLSFELLSSTEWAGRFAEAAFHPNVYVDISSTLAIKLSAMQAYASELKEYPHPRSIRGLEIQAQKRGLDVGLPLAEAFHLIREIR